MPKVAEAGRRGDGVRSDCWVRFESTDSGGLRIGLTSKVASLYGSSIREDVARVVEALGLSHASLTVEDSGAVPFVIAARVEAAVKRALPETAGEYLPDLAEHALYPTSRERLRRSRLYLPGNEPKFCLNAGLHRPDAVILDLEDSVTPTEKDAARLVVRNALRQVDFCDAERMVRINPPPGDLDDLDAVVPHNVHVLLIPKCESAESVQAVAKRVEEIRAAHKVEREVHLMPIVETSLGVVRAYEIASASPAVVGLAIGLEDYTADIGAPRSREGKESIWARSAVVNAARAAGVAPVNSVFSDVADMVRLRDFARESKGLGFEGMGCIHPRQIAVVHEAFAPTVAELEKAREIVAAFEEAKARGSGVVSLGSKMIDPPVVKRALRTVRFVEGGGGDE